MDLTSKHLGKRLTHWKLILWAVSITVFWMIFWFWSWQKYLESFIWLRIGVGLLLFILPGACLYDLVSKRSHLTLSHITFGFAISHLVFALLGTFGRLLHLSFEAIKLLMALMGFILLIIFLLKKFPSPIKVDVHALNINRILPILLLFFIACIACLIIIQRVLADDDLTYLALLTNWQHAVRLNFNEVLFGKQELMHPRFWIVSAPFAQALLSDISRVPGIVMLSGYYEVFLVILAVLSWHELYRSLTLSDRVASASSMLHLVFLLLLSDYLHPGASFINQLSVDKATAAFIMAPIFFQSLIKFLKKSTKSNLIIFLLAGSSLTFTHPVILAYSAFIGGMLVFFNWMNLKPSQKIPATMILVLILLPQVALRFTSASSQVEIPYTTNDILSQSGVENMVTRWRETNFYGFNPAILDMHFPFTDNIPLPQPILTRGWLVFPILAAAFALRQKKKRLTELF